MAAPIPAPRFRRLQRRVLTYVEIRDDAVATAAATLAAIQDLVQPRDGIFLTPQGVIVVQNMSRDAHAEAAAMVQAAGRDYAFMLGEAMAALATMPPEFSRALLAFTTRAAEATNQGDTRTVRDMRARIEQLIARMREKQDGGTPRTVDSLPAKRAKIEGFDCVVCFETVADRPRVLPCEHQLTCDACLLKLKKWECPLCRAGIEEVIRHT